MSEQKGILIAHLEMPVIYVFQWSTYVVWCRSLILPRWLPLMSWMSMEGRLGVDWICTHTDSMEQRTTACPDLCAPEKFDEWGDLRWKSSAYHLCHLDQLCAHQWQSRLDHFCQEKHSLVAVKIIPAVEIILVKELSSLKNGEKLQ